MSAAGAPPALSLVIPVHDEETSVGPLHGELARVLPRVAPSWEILFVDDGSGDGTRDRLEALRTTDPHVRVVELDGNFGEAAALSAGFAHARGSVVVTLDGDGQNDPADIPHLLARLTPDVDVVSGRRRWRREAFLGRVVPSWIANRLIRVVTGIPVHDCGCGLKVYRRALLAGVRLPRGTNRFLPAILGVDPGRVAEVWVGNRARRGGRSHYGLGRTLAVVRDVLAFPMLVRPRPGPRARAPRLALVRAVVVLLPVAVVAALGWPAGAAASWSAALAGAIVTVGAVAVVHRVWQARRARTVGVYRVRRVA